ncbi:MAG: Holliday junction resolvase RuvX [Pyrinomonadaceae bacterium]
MQQKEITNPLEVADVFADLPTGRILAIDPGTKRCGIAVCDELQATTRPLAFIERSSWKKLLSNIKNLISEYDAKALVVGLPLESDGSESQMSEYARRLDRNFTISLEIPVFLQDERVTSYEAKGRLWERGITPSASRKLVDSEAAAIILSDFLDRMASLSR